jgi:hypothetical protein
VGDRSADPIREKRPHPHGSWVERLLLEALTPDRLALAIAALGELEAKSAVARPEERKFLGFTISNDGSERRIAPKALDKFKTQVRDKTPRTRGISLQQLIEDLTPYLIGWRGYFGLCQTHVCSRTSKRGSAEDYARIFGGSGRTGTTASTNCADGEFIWTYQLHRSLKRHSRQAIGLLLKLSAANFEGCASAISMGWHHTYGHALRPFAGGIWGESKAEALCFRWLRC